MWANSVIRMRTSDPSSLNLRLIWVGFIQFNRIIQNFDSSEVMCTSNQVLVLTEVQELCTLDWKWVVVRVFSVSFMYLAYFVSPCSSCKAVFKAYEPTIHSVQTNFHCHVTLYFVKIKQKDRREKSSTEQNKLTSETTSLGSFSLSICYKLRFQQNSGCDSHDPGQHQPLVVSKQSMWLAQKVSYSASVRKDQTVSPSLFRTGIQQKTEVKAYAVYVFQS